MTTYMEILSIGNELLIGKISNTNGQWLARSATFLGITVRRMTVVSDEVEEISTAMNEALNRKPDFVVTTGGLGPTFDDKTLQGLAKALDRKLEVNSNALKMVKEKYDSYFLNRQIDNNELTPPRIKMATIPERSKPIPNPIGTAPAVLAKTNSTTIVSLPGVPREMEAIFNESIAPLLRRAADNIAFYEKRVFADKIVESSMAPLIDKVMKENPGVYIKSHPKGVENRPHIEIHLSLKALETEKPLDKLGKAAKQLVFLIDEQGGKAFIDS